MSTVIAHFPRRISALEMSTPDSDANNVKYILIRNRIKSFIDLLHN